MDTTTTTSTSCISHFTLRSNPGSNGACPKVRGSGSPGCSRLDGVAAWLVNGIATAFFASLDRCSCIRIATEDDLCDEGNNLPLLIYNDGNLRGEGSSGAVRRRRRKGNKRAGAFVLED